ncbi:NlpC/P60 family protein [uncultured Lacinutrix sp.]|uniref:NlpC/P60 family protein n=1 Tax=uncultured Lacinutrix sp. TaxID=574032 RepID=UPI0026060B7E|nr:NlpC/P60 family protein [uncultured Lacinutrix sp.]
MLKTLAPFLILLISFQTYSQSSFKGVVTENDETMFVNDAIVEIEGTAIAQTTDSNGSFTFTEKIPDGEHVVTITKEGYVTGYFLIDVALGKSIAMTNSSGKKINSNSIIINPNKKERKRREKASKEQEKIEKKIRKEREKTIANAQKEKEKRDKLLEKNKKKLLKQKKKNGYDDEPEPVIVEDVPEENIITPLQKKYSEILNVSPESITNTKLYELVEEWNGVPYLLGGSTKKGIDCSAITLMFSASAFNIYIERTADTQYLSENTEHFRRKEYLQEGNLIFFNETGDETKDITHVGMYLANNYFVHSSKSTKGVAISNLDEPLWKKMYVASGKRSKN